MPTDREKRAAAYCQNAVAHLRKAKGELFEGHPEQGNLSEVIRQVGDIIHWMTHGKAPNE